MGQFSVEISALPGSILNGNQHRLNVAISRAQALAIVVANPKLANTAVTSLEQMQQVNFFAELVSSGAAGNNSVHGGY